MTTTELTIPEALDGERLDRALATLVEGTSRARIQKDLDAGAVLLNGQPPSRGAKTAVRTGDAVVYTPPPPEPLDLVAEDIPLDVVFEDEHLLVVNKAAGIVVHPALGHPRGTLVNAVLFHVRNLEAHPDADVRPGVVHRLDRDTTGLICFAKHPEAHDKLAAKFKDRQIEKVYLAVTRGVPKPPKGTIETLYGRHPTDRKKFSSKVRSGKRACTHYETREVFRGAAHVRVTLDTGRTHQIRVHFADLGHPLVGDETYGRRRAAKTPDDPLATFARPALHAHRLAFAHPITGAPLELEAAVPDDLQSLLQALR